MKSIRISDKAYAFLKSHADLEHRTIIGTLELLIDLFKDSITHEMGKESLPSSNKG